MPLKLGHNAEQAMTDGQPALGWVARVYRDGKKLLADFTDLPTVLYEAIKAGLYKFISVELMADVKADTRQIPWVLDAVAILGADIPAVGVLKDLQSLTLARASNLPHRARLAFSREPPDGGDSTRVPGEQNDDMKAILKRLEDAEKERDVLKVTAARVETAERQVAELKAQTNAERVTAHRAKISELFEAAIKDKKILPVVRERFKRAYPFDKDDVLNIQVADVESFIRENPNPDAPRVVQGLSGTGDHAPVDARVDEKFVFATRKVMRENSSDQHFAAMPRSQQIIEAAKKALASDPDAAEAYRHMPETVE